jgi:hypothetical protein
VALGLAVGLGKGVEVSLGTGVIVGVSVGRGVSVGTGVLVATGVAVGMSVGVGVTEGVREAVAVAVAVKVGLGVRVGVAEGAMRACRWGMTEKTATATIIQIRMMAAIIIRRAFISLFSQAVSIGAKHPDVIVRITRRLCAKVRHALYHNPCYLPSQPFSTNLLLECPVTRPPALDGEA